MSKSKKTLYERPRIKTFDVSELEEELGYTNGTTGHVDLQGGS